MSQVKNRLLNYDAIIYQDDEWFKFSLDSLLLSWFVTINLRCRKIIDLATGNAPIPMLLSYRTKALIYGVELQECIFQLGRKSVIENQMSEQIRLIHDDINNVHRIFESDSFDVVVTNPPYFKTKDYLYFNENDVKAIARHEIKIHVEQVLEKAFYLLKTGGIFAMVFTTSRFIEVITLMKKYRIEPKRIQFVYPKIGKESDLFLIEGIKNGKSGVKILEPLIVYDENNEYTVVVRNMFQIGSE